MKTSLFSAIALLIVQFAAIPTSAGQQADADKASITNTSQPAVRQYNVLLIMSDDLTATALSCYGNSVCRTPHIDALAAAGTRFSQAYCQATYCGPSRASMLTGYYPHATGVLGYTSPRPSIGDRATWPQYFKDHGYYTARVSKIFHMGVPGGIEIGGDGRQHNDYNGADDPLSWTERFNSPGPEWKAAGTGETLENNANGKRPVTGGNTFVAVEADGDDHIHSDGITTNKVIQILMQPKDKPFWLGVGFVRPHVPFVAPAVYFEPFKPFTSLQLPPKIPGDWDDIPTAGINYKTSVNMQMNERQQKKALGSYYACVQFIDHQVGRIMHALRQSKLDDSTIVIFTSDHGYHLGEHDFWAKVSLREESAAVPLIIYVPGQKPAVCHSLVELLDLFPTTASLCGLKVPTRLQGLDASSLISDPQQNIRSTAFSVAPMRDGFLLRDDRYAYIQYGEDAEKGVELFDMHNDPKQFSNLASSAEHSVVANGFKSKLAARLASIRNNDLP